MSFDVERARRLARNGWSVARELEDACDEIERLRADAICARSAIDWCIGYAEALPRAHDLRRQLREARAYLGDDAAAAT